MKFSSNFAKFEMKHFAKFLQNYENMRPPYVGVQCGGEEGQVSPGASSALRKIVLYSSSVYTVFHSVIYNSVVLTLFAVTAIQYF